MKNSNLFKKFAVMVVSAMMVITSFAMPTFAQTGDTTLKVSNVPQNGVIIKAYKLIKQDDKGNWIPANNLTATQVGIDNKGEVTADSANILALAQKTDWPANSAITGFSYDTNTKLWTKNLPDPTGKEYGESDTTGAGMYLVLVENDATDLANVKVYNPMIVSIDPSGEEGALVAGTVDANGEFEIDAENGTSGTAYAKSSAPAFDKYILRKSDVAANANISQLNDAGLADTTNLKNTAASGEGKYGDTGTSGGYTDTTDPKVGSKVWYEIKVTIPAYADNYFVENDSTDPDAPKYKKAPKFNVYDRLSSGLSFNNDIQIFTVAGDNVTEVTNTNNADYTVVTEDIGENDYKVVFDPDFLKGGVQKEVVIRYSATIQEGCKTNFDPETNTAKIEYTHKPWEEQESEEITTYHYTFTINGDIDGEGSSVLRELVKVGCDEDSNFVYAETNYEENHYKEPIKDAVFRMYTEAQMNAGKTAPLDADKYYREGTSQADGRILGFDELDAGVYYIVEQSVPSPYKKKTDPIKIEISAVLNSEGLLTEYKIMVRDVQAAKYTAVYDEDGNITTINGKDEATFNAGTREAFNQAATEVLDVEAAHIQNTKTGSLPSTGGIGTVVFTVGGIAIMALALFLLFGAKKKEQE